MDFTLFGVPMIGADICGFLDDTTEELCARWIEVGAFYPFSRNHNALGQAPQELYLWDSVSTASKTYLNMRYRLLPYYYTLQYGASNDGRSTLATALWMNFPTDEVVVELNYQFMIGSAIMISPVVEMGETSVNAYFPNGLWYNMNDGYKLAVDATVGTAGEGMYVELDTPLTSTNVHLYGGKTLPMQEAAMTTALARTTPFTLLVALCPGGKSYGSLYWDNGEDVTVKDYLTVAYTTETSLEAGDDLNYISGIVSTHGDISAFNMLKISTIIVTSSSLAAPSNIMVGTKNLSTNSIVYDKTNHILTLSDLDLAITEDFKITWE